MCVEEMGRRRHRFWPLNPPTKMTQAIMTNDDQVDQNYDVDQRSR